MISKTNFCELGFWLKLDKTPATQFSMSIVIKKVNFGLKMGDLENRFTQKPFLNENSIIGENMCHDSKQACKLSCVCVKHFQLHCSDVVIVIYSTVQKSLAR